MPTTQEVDPQSVCVRFRVADKDTEHSRPWTAIDIRTLSSLAPWRTFRWYKGQKHYSGSWWTATEQDLVIYESRLELARLLYADFDLSVSHIVAQPFLLSATVEKAVRSHILDYLLLDGALGRHRHTA